MEDINSAAQIIEALALDKSVPTLVPIEDCPSIRIVKEVTYNPSTCGFSTSYRALDLEAHSGAPNRTKEKVEFHDAETFVDYVKYFSGDGSRIFFDTDKVTFAAIIDYPSDGSPEWGDHVASLTLRHSNEWKLWFDKNGKHLSQKEFGRFIEDNQVDVIDPSGTALLDLIMTFTATKNVQFHEANRLQNGQTELIWKEDVKTGSTVIPYKLKIFVPVYFNEDPEEVELFFRYRVNDQTRTLELAVEFYRHERVKNEAAKKIVARVKDQTELPVHFGKRLSR
jgi:uncharacterized protein YfdQ (DUF2303 family)